LNLERPDEMRSLGQAGVVPLHVGVFVHFNRRNRCAELKPVLHAESNFPQVSDIFQIDDVFRAADAGAHLKYEIGAATERARFFPVLAEQLERLIDRAWSFVIDRVQERKTSPAALLVLVRPKNLLNNNLIKACRKDQAFGAAWKPADRQLQ
jgi:hypothetical protein